MLHVTDLDGMVSVCMLNGLVVSISTLRLSVHSIAVILPTLYASIFPLVFFLESLRISSGSPRLLDWIVPVMVILHLARYSASSGLV